MGDNRGAAEAFCRSRATFDRFDLAISRRSMRHEGIEQVLCDMSYLIDCAIESFFICLRWPGESAQLPNELNR
jgi:hypothetical protein